MGAYIFDIETDGLYDDVTKIHCLSYTRVGELKPKTLTKYSDIERFFKQDDLTLIGHFITVYDIPVIKKILGIDFKPVRVIDTLGISWYLNSSKDSSFKHGLEQYGEKFGILKPEVKDWVNLTIEDYTHRCEEDVKINYNLWCEQSAQLSLLYDDDWKEIFRLINYIHFKMDCMAEQQDNRLKLDINLINYEIKRLKEISEDKRSNLLKVMPKVANKSKKVMPKVMQKADGSISANAEKWYRFLKEQGLSEDTEGEVVYVVGYEEPNPDSTTQIKDWLFSLGWIPRHLKHVKNKKTNEVKKVPQIVSEYNAPELCESVLELAEKVPEISELAGYSTVNHRIGVYEGFLRDMDSRGYLQADFGGFTNTFRFKHRKIVNLPNPSAPYAEKIRASFITEDGCHLVGSDLSGIEDATKLHYLYKYDPDYVETMQNEDWDAHLDICIRAGVLTEEQVSDHKSGKSNYKSERQKGKTVNFSATYGVGANTLATNMKVPVPEAKKILEAYWERNWSIKKFASDCKVKVISGQMWVQQPISRFWYTLRKQQDVFSTVNQGSAVYVFDIWVMFCRQLGMKMRLQTHDEHVHCSDKKPSEIKELIQESIRKVNEYLKLNIEIKCSTEIGRTYLEVH